MPSFRAGVLRREHVRARDVADVAGDRGAARGLAPFHDALDESVGDAPAVGRGECRSEDENIVVGNQVDPARKRLV